MEEHMTEVGSEAPATAASLPHPQQAQTVSVESILSTTGNFLLTVSKI